MTTAPLRDSMSDDNAIVAAALRYAEEGFPVFPIAPGSKTPKAGSRGFRDATVDPEVIRQRFTEPCNLGLAIPPGLFVLDVDRPEALLELKAQDMDLPATARQLTPGGGAHYVYRLPPGVILRQTAGEIVPGVDTRAAGRGFIVASPSVIDGRQYVWEVPPRPENIAEAPAWMIEAFRERQTVSDAEHCQPFDTAATLGGVPEGARHQECVRLAGRLLRAEVPLSAAAELGRIMARQSNPPGSEPFTEGEAAETIADVYRRYRRAPGTSVEWPSPQALPQEEGEAPELPADLLPAPLSDFVLDAAERASGPPEFIAAGLLCAIGNLLGRNVALYLKQRDSWHEHANLWGLLVAPPGVQKSPLLEAALHPLRRIEARRRETWEQEDLTPLTRRLAGVEIELASLMRTRKGGDSPDPERITNLRREKRHLEIRIHSGAPRFTTADATAEKLGELLVANPGGLLLVRDELTGWLDNLEREGRQGERAFFLQGWTGREGFDVDRIGRGSLHVPAVCLGVLGTIQPGPLARYVREAAGGAGADGLLQRFQLVVYPQPKQFRYVDRQPDQAALRAVQDLFDALVRSGLAERLGAADQSGGLPKGLRLEPPAQALFVEWYEEIMRRAGKEACAPFAAWLAKEPKLFAGLVLIFHAVEVLSGGRGAGSVGLLSARQAADCCGFFEQQARKVLAPLLRPELTSALALAEKIKGGTVADGMKLRDVYKPGWKSLATVDAVEGAADQLAALGWVQVENADTGGRPARVLRINPAVLES